MTSNSRPAITPQLRQQPPTLLDTCWSPEAPTIPQAPIGSCGVWQTPSRKLQNYPYGLNPNLSFQFVLPDSTEFSGPTVADSGGGQSSRLAAGRKLDGASGPRSGPGSIPEIVWVYTGRRRPAASDAGRRERWGALRHHDDWWHHGPVLVERRWHGVQDQHRWERLHPVVDRKSTRRNS